MKNISRRSFISQLGAAGAIAGGIIVSPEIRAKSNMNKRNEWQNTRHDNFIEQAHAGSIPDPEHLIPRGRGWKVLPNGFDDHDNLEWALKNTVSGGKVKLVRGLYKIGRPVVVADFDGTLAGAGAAHTTITCTDALNYELWEKPGGGRDMGEPKPAPFPRIPVNGSTTLTAPGLIVFYKTPLQPEEIPTDRANQIKIRNLRCRGAMTGQLWMFGDEVLCFSIINSFDWDDPRAVHETTRQDVKISGVEADGYRTPEFGPFENACACITVLGGIILTSNYNLEGDVDGDALGPANGGLLDVTPAEGDISITSCTFRNCRLGPGVVGYKGGTLLWQNNITDGCRGNCLQMFDNSDTSMVVRGNDLFCDSFELPPFLVGGTEGVPSSLGCVVAIQGIGATLGWPTNIQWWALAYDEAAHAAHPEAGPLGAWRPQGSGVAPQPSILEVRENSCSSSQTANTYCFHIVDLANLAFGFSTLSVVVKENDCSGSETCVSLEHLNQVSVTFNECSSQAFGVELHNSPGAVISRNSFDFPQGVDNCEIRILSLGEKIDLSRVVPGAGACMLQD